MYHQGGATVSSENLVNPGLFPTNLRSRPEGAAAIGNHLVVALSWCLLSMMFTCDCHKASRRLCGSPPTQGGLHCPSLCRADVFPKISDPTAKWNSSSSFLSRYKAESEPSLSGALVTEGKCIKEYAWMECS